MATDELNVAAELARLRGEMCTGFERMTGQLNLLVQSTDGIRDDVEDVRADVDKLDKRVSALEARKLPAGFVAGVSGAVSTAVAVAAFMVR